MIEQLASIGMGGIGGVIGAILLQEVMDSGSSFFSDKVSEELTALDVRQSDAVNDGDRVTFHDPGVTGVYRGVDDDKIVVEVDDGVKFLPLEVYEEPFTVIDTNGRTGD